MQARDQAKKRNDKTYAEYQEGVTEVQRELKTFLTTLNEPKNELSIQDVDDMVSSLRQITEDDLKRITQELNANLMDTIYLPHNQLDTFRQLKSLQEMQHMKAKFESVDNSPVCKDVSSNK